MTLIAQPCKYLQILKGSKALYLLNRETAEIEVFELSWHLSLKPQIFRASYLQHFCALRKTLKQ